MDQERRSTKSEVESSILSEGSLKYAPLKLNRTSMSLLSKKMQVRIVPGVFYIGGITQLEKYSTDNRMVAGSSPTASTMAPPLSQ